MRKFAIVLLLFLVSGNSVSAEESKLSISPTTIIVKATSDKPINIDLTLSNESDSKASLRLAYRTIEGMDEDGNVILKAENNLSESDVLLRGTLKLYKDETPISDLELSPRSETKVRLSIPSTQIPKGEYYFSVLFISKDNNKPQDTSTSFINSGIGSNVILRIGKDEPVSGFIKEFSSPFFLTHGPVEFKLNLVNSSTQFVRPSGSIEVFDMFGRTLDKIDIRGDLVLAHSERKLRSKQYNVLSWNQKNIFGIYYARANVELGEKELPTQTTIFIALPLPIFAVILVISFTVGGIVIKYHRKMISYKSKISRK